MRVLVDTSVWVDFFNGHPSAEQGALAVLLESDHEVCTCGVVVAEVFQGLRHDRSRREIAALFRDQVFLADRGIATYFGAAELYRRLRGAGVTVRSTIDCLVAIMAEENGCALLGRDRDLEAIVASGFAKVEPWRVDRPARG